LSDRGCRDEFVCYYGTSTKKGCFIETSSNPRTRSWWATGPDWAFRRRIKENRNAHGQSWENANLKNSILEKQDGGREALASEGKEGAQERSTGRVRG